MFGFGSENICIRENTYFFAKPFCENMWKTRAHSRSSAKKSLFLNLVKVTEILHYRKKGKKSFSFQFLTDQSLSLRLHNILLSSV